jgi:integrase
MTRRAGKLSRDAVKRLAIGEKINDGGTIAERLADGDIRWTVNVMISGRRIHRVIGKASEGVDRAACIAFIERVRTEERSGRLDLPTGRKTWLSFQQLSERYLKRMEEGGGRNLTSKRQHLNQWLIPYFGKQRGDTLTQFTVDTYKKKRLAAGAAAGTVNRELATLKHMLRDAVKEKDMKVMPCAFEMLAEPPGRMVILSQAEADALMAAAIGDQDPDTWLFVAFGLNTAMRHREILRARFDEISWNQHRLFVPLAKAGAREQPLTPALVTILRKERAARGDDAGYIFKPRGPAKGGRGYRGTMQKSFRRAVVRAGLDPTKVTPHVMRHTAITRLVVAKVDLPTIQRISGHKTLSMVLRYVHVSGAHIDDAMAALERTCAEQPGAAENAAATHVTQELHTPPAGWSGAALKVV